MRQPDIFEEKLGQIRKVVDALNERKGSVILVEGRKDEIALRNAGVDGEFIHVQSFGGPIRASEYVSETGKTAVIMTDWDRRGNLLAESLETNLAALDVRYDTRLRTELASACRAYAKDVESLDSVVAYLGREDACQDDGCLIVLEGIDGSGKSSMCAAIAAELRKEGKTVETTAEPTHVRIGSLIRSGAFGNISQMTEAILFTADRNDHTENMKKWIYDGKIVICDRYFASTVAYQSSGLDGRSLDRSVLLRLNSMFTGIPRLTLLLDLDPSVSAGRIASRGMPDRYENIEFQRRVRAEYLRLAGEFGFRIVDASGRPEEVLEQCMSEIKKVL